MIRRILMMGILSTLLMSAAAQDNAFPLLHTIATPFYDPVIRLSPDGGLLAVHENQLRRNQDAPVPVDLPILLFDLESGSEVGRLEDAQTDIARSVAFSPDGTRLASYHANGDLIVWDIATQEALQVYDWLPMGGSSMDFMPDGQTLVLLTYSNGLTGQHILFDLAAGSITDILGLRPDTLAESQDLVAGSIEVMGRYGVAAQTIGPNGELYGATGNGDVYRWDTEARLRELIYPASSEHPLSVSVGKLQVLDDGSLAFLDSNLGEVVKIGPDGAYNQYPLKGQQFALSENGIVVLVDRWGGALYWSDLNVGAQEPQRLDIIPGQDQDNPVNLPGEVALVFTPEGELIVGDLYPSEDGSSIYVVDMP